MSSTTYQVRGMTCDHCARAVTAEVSGLPGVVDVRVDVDAGQVHVTAADGTVDRDALRGAIEEAGYELTS